MRLRHRSSPFVALLLLSPFLASALAEADPTSDQNARLASRKRLTTDDAPVDGKDGKPHHGPFVDTTVDTSGDKQSTLDDIVVKGRPEDITIHEGKKIPETNDGVMNDKPLKAPEIDGTEGGVSERTRDRKAKEEETGEVAENPPIKPDDHPPIPSSEEDKMSKTTKTTKTDSDREKAEKAGSGDGSGLEKPDDLPELPHEAVDQPLPQSAQKDHLDLNAGTLKGKVPLTGDDNEGLIQPLHSFFLSFTMIIFSEIGDKTFLVACLMAMKHDRMVVFSAAFAALATMTVLSAMLGHAVPTLIPKHLTNFLACILFFVFGARLLKEGLAMDPDEGVSEEMHEVERELAEKESEARRAGNVSAYDMEAGYAGHRKSRSASRLRSPRSPSSSPEAKQRKATSDSGLKGLIDGIHNLLSLLLSPAWVQTFVMTFLGEWGDRSQIATIAMAAGQDYWWVTLGAVLGHACCTGVAVIGGRAIAGRVSMKVVTVGGAIAFLVFGFIYFIEGFYA